MNGLDAAAMDTATVCSGALASAVGDSNFTLLRVDIHGFTDGVRANDNAFIYDSFIHDMFEDVDLDTHNDCIQSVGGSNVVCRHNTLENANTQTSCFIFGPSA